MIGKLRMMQEQLELIITDLRRSHAIVYERFGLLGCRFTTSNNSLLLYPVKYVPFDDNLYERNKDDMTILLGAKGIQFAMSFAYTSQLACFYIHLHHHTGSPFLSEPDIYHADYMIDDLFKVRPQSPHGFFVSSLTSVSGVFKMKRKSPQLPISATTIIGHKLHIQQHERS